MEQDGPAGSPLRNKSEPANTSAPPKVGLPHVLKVINRVFGAANPGVAKIKSLNPQQKTVLVITVLLERERKERKWTVRAPLEPTVARIFELYQLVCSKTHMMTALSRAEFFSVVDGIEASGLIDFGKGSGLASGASTPKAGLASGRSTPQKIGKRQNGTPIRLSTPRTPKTQPGTPKAHTPMTMEGTSRIVLLANEQEIEQGLDSLQFLKEFLRDGLPQWAFPNPL
jgi:Cdc6-like AAA superfamily ATPase